MKGVREDWVLSKMHKNAIKPNKPNKPNEPNAYEWVDVYNPFLQQRGRRSHVSPRAPYLVHSVEQVLKCIYRFLVAHLFGQEVLRDSLRNAAAVE